MSSKYDKAQDYDLELEDEHNKKKKKKDKKPKQPVEKDLKSIIYI